jgi:hypothetical protein
MRCPVCRKEIVATDKCPYCGFSQLNRTFVNREEAMLWEKEVVVPYRNNHLFSSKGLAIAKRRMIQEVTNIARKDFYELFAGMVENKSWVSAPVNDKQLLILPFRGGYYISIYSDMNNRRPGESRDVITADINIFIDCLFDNPHLLGIVVDPNQDPVLISRKEINGLTIRKDPRLQIKDWGVGIPKYTERDLMVEEELLDFGIDVIEEHFVNKNGYEILEINRGADGFPNFALRKNGILYLMKVDAAVTNKPTLTREKREFYVNSCRRFNAKCLYAPLALISSDPERAEAGIALCGDGFHANFTGVEELN